MVKYHNLLKKHVSSIILSNCHTSDDSAVGIEVRKAISRSSNTIGGRSSHYLMPVSSSSEVLLCRKLATTMICLSSLSEQLVEASSADSLIQVRPKTSQTTLVEKPLELCECTMNPNKENHLSMTRNLHKAESVPYAKQVSNLMSKYSLGSTIEDGEKSIEAPMNIAAANERLLPTNSKQPEHLQSPPTPMSTMLNKYLNKKLSQSTTKVDKIVENENCQLVEEAKKNLPMSAQIEKILAMHSEKKAEGSTAQATDFSCTLLQKLLNQGKESEIPFVLSPSCLDAEQQVPMSSSSQLGGRRTSMTNCVSEVADKIVAKMIEMKDTEKKRSRLQYIKNVFDKIIASSPGFSSKLKKIHDAYKAMSSSDTKISWSDTEYHLPASTSLSSITQIEKDLAVEQAEVNGMMVQLTEIKETADRMDARVQSEESILTELRKLKDSLCEEE